MIKYPFVRTHLVGDELSNVAQALDKGHLQGDGPFTARCHEWLQSVYKAPAVLTHSCTAALEMGAILSGCEAGDEVIMPSYTFVSTANAFVLRGAVPVFVDVRADTLNMDEKLLEAAITPKTKAIVPVHYAGVSCDMKTICAVAKHHNLMVVEDAAQAIGATYCERPVGTFGHVSAFSFHQTKNVVSGEGGALIVNDGSLVERTSIIREKGTNRSQFLRREVAKYEWLDIGSSYLPSDIIAAVLYAQLQKVEEITKKRLSVWNAYHAALKQAEDRGLLQRPVIPSDCGHNAHIYYVLLPLTVDRARVLEKLHENGVGATSHYVPLHSAPAGLRFGRVGGAMNVTDRVASSLMRLPLYHDLSEGDVDAIVTTLVGCLSD